MIIYAHRGNLKGPNPKKENHPDYIAKALKEGFFAEIDVWYYKNEWWLGHDKPQYKCCIGGLKNWSQQAIFHAKNTYALQQLTKEQRFHYFWLQEDDYTVTSWGYVWVHHGKRLVKNSIAALPEVACVGNLKKCYGICTDFPEKYLDLC